MERSSAHRTPGDPVAGMALPVYIVCGGTGGHLAPGIATAQRLIRAGISVELVVSEKEVDSRLLESYPDLNYRRVKGAPFRLSPKGLFLFVLHNTRSFISGFQYLRKNPPAMILAFGGFISVSYVIAAWLLKVPIVLHEANRVVGRSIRFLSGMADTVFLPDGVSLAGIEARRIRRLGMPLREEVKHVSKETIRREMDIPHHAKVLVVVGGSQGAKALNDWVEETHKSLASDGIWIILVTGPGKNQMPELKVLQSDMGVDVEIRTFAFHRSLHELFSCADVVLSRAGAGTVAELVCCLAPSILVPFPYAADDHQLANAQDLERRGGCIVIDQKNSSNLYREVLDLIFNDWLLGRMRQNLRRLNHGDAAENLTKQLIESYYPGHLRATAVENSTEAKEAVNG
ncbi:UDP-N-acetylglucosamine--N-acetylmuramyl-(pentapeptide) pyrophosphoryl-undecaprenol N-acetylglucosamine transferase [Puniceicoccales bacterium CK1056]|uniref:UDP-N-acetylglucosamine--N-acetylmuramyl-(pentapeptide) pyrophosphoryl-undecaprenol N-acetylglucosamine transferase n=1 Tax=Oceanipulchritudo coccoides TaxID=2706888 RepID=A0A6B2M4T4_9BACT|nr:UDP-N-acetylglucosamine--N-acetylmuramyl-(pentapeptide) pyrophosphoryl-undecaprenol N-acetylglucosamine transferase [Oceanipulchritudo coccoides]NDV63292.1 UDP-N-acetylglucosamine--N-acetylmuramyl-(pentapeptide) pyrophosphoryl-undecaprenol N-acetylglucosamine transferase [Oceanipulchritudo coccoides]